MNITLKEGINFNSRSLRHSIVLQAVTLIEGRESALRSEKEIYTIIAFMDKICDGNIIEYCNENTEELMIIYSQKIEPAFLDLMNNKEAEEFYYLVMCDVDEYCERVYHEQHSITGFLNALLDAVVALTPEQSKEVLLKTGEMAAKIKKQHNDNIEEQNRMYKRKIVETQDEINSSIQQLMEKYNVSTKDTE